MPKVWIDAGHGGSDPGAVGPGNRYEKDDNLACATKLRDFLLSRGVEVVMTRTADVTIGYQQRAALEAGCDLAISCHRNGATTDAACGAEIWLHGQVTVGSSIEKWASDIIAGIGEAGMSIRAGQIAKGVYRGYPGFPNDNFWVNRLTKSPSMLIELGFVTNPVDNALFDAKLDQLVRAIADATCRMLLVEWEEGEAAPEAESELLAELKGLVEQYKTSGDSELMAKLTILISKYAAKLMGTVTRKAPEVL